MSKFIREDRYLVIKRKDIQNHLNSYDRKLLYDLADRINEHAPPSKEIQYVVVESDWPEFETVWAMIEKRVIMEEKKKTESLKGGRYE